jgi:hypothetical protein
MVSLRAASCAALLSVLAAGALSACNRNEAASTSSSGQAYAADRHANRSSGGGYGDDGPRPPVPMFHGEPMWSQTRAHDARDQAEYHFRRDGQSLGARTLDDFLTKVHAFGDHPPHGTEIITRSNGDRLMYDPKANLFGVFTRDGAPRTILKPPEGKAYWAAQKAREADGGGDYHARSHRNYGRSDGGGYGGQGGSSEN